MWILEWRDVDISEDVYLYFHSFEAAHNFFKIMKIRPHDRSFRIRSNDEGISVEELQKSHPYVDAEGLKGPVKEIWFDKDTFLIDWFDDAKLYDPGFHEGYSGEEVD